METTTTKEITLDGILNEFLSTDNLKPALKKPCLIDGYVYGTDGHVLIKIPESLLFTKHSTFKEFPNVERVINPPLLDEKLTIGVDQIRRMLDIIPLQDKFAPCSECDEGNIECNLGHSHDCQRCDGLGNSTTVIGKEYSHLDLMKIDKAHYNPNFILLLEKVCLSQKVNSFTIISQGYNTAMKVIVNDITVLIMPVGYKEDPEKYKEYIL